MKDIIRGLLVSLLLILIASPGLAGEKTYKIEVLQVTSVAPFQQSYTGFINELAKNGIVQGKNLTIKRTIIDFDIEKGGLWKKVGVLMRIKSEAQRIADDKPDLVLTIGTPATKYAKNAIISAGIPLVFTDVAIPQAAGCRSLTEAGPGFTGATLYMNMKDALRIVKLAFPDAKTIGIVHSDDDNAIAHTEEAKKYGPAMGLKFLTRQVSKSDPITPAAEELVSKGVKAFIVPLDTYYGLRNNRPTKDIAEVSRATKIPIISFILYKSPGAVFYVGSDFTIIGELSGRQAVKILQGGVKPEAIPIARQEDLKIMVDVKQLKAIGVHLPMEILQLAKPID